MDSRLYVGGVGGLVGFLFTIISAFSPGWIIMTWPISAHFGLYNVCHIRGCTGYSVIPNGCLMTLLFECIGLILLFVGSVFNWEGIYNDDIKKVRVGGILTLVAGIVIFLGVGIFVGTQGGLSSSLDGKFRILYGYSYHLGWFGGGVSFIAGSVNIYVWRKT